MAEFEHYVCWDRDRVFSVLNLEAERADRSTFLAIHSDHPLKVVTAAAGGALGSHATDMPVEEFVRRFLEPRAQHIQAVIVGDSGTGKSHFIKWLSMRIEETPDRIVLAIPKSGTSLRGIVEMILDRLPADEAAKHRAALETDAFDIDTPANKRRRLAAYIALELGNAQPAPGNELEKWLLDDRLRLLFSDVHLLETKLAQEGGIMDRLVDHVGNRRGAGASDGLHEFTLRDLPRAGADVRDAAAETRKVLNLLAGDEGMEAAAVALVNRALGPALARALAFSPDRLIEVMGQLRRHLAAQGKELVLLIEDFARLQGIDGGLMQALIEAGGRDTGLCPLRWCMAVTTGPYEAVVRSTLKTRLDLVVDMTQTAAGFGANNGELAGFAAKYLNAARVAASALEKWAAKPEQGPVPNACVSCDFMTRCHEAFGDHEGVGLYPFTEQVLPHMLALVDPDGGDQFNPRQFIKGVLKPTLADFDLEWRELKTFPSAAYDSALGGPDKSKIDIHKEEWIRRNYPVDTERWMAFLDLWGDDELRFNVEVARAFGLTPPLTTVVDPAEPAPAPVPEAAGPDQRLIDALNDWGRGEPLADWATSRLRPMVLDAVETAIDWDAAGITPGFFLRGTAQSFFKAANISFQRQVLATMPGEVELRIPVTDDDAVLRQASIALQALVTVRSGAPFKADYGPQGLAQLGAHLEVWTESVLSQLGDLARQLGPLDDACELLLYRTALAGHVPDFAVDWINAAFTQSEPIIPPSAAWQRIYDALDESRTEAQGYVRALISASKGGQVGAVIDPRPMLAALDRIRSSGQHVQGASPGEGTPPIRKAMAIVHAELQHVVETEASRQLDWHASYSEHLGSLDNFGSLHSLVTDLRQELIRCGVPFSAAKGSAALDTLERLIPSHVDRAFEATGNLGDEPDRISLAQVADPERWAVIRHWDAAVPAVNALLDEVDASVSGVSDVAAIVAAMDNSEARIEPLLTALVATSGELEAER